MKHNNGMMRLWALVLALCVIVVQVPQFARAEEPAAEIPVDAIYLTCAEDLLVLAESCIRDSWSRDKVVVLTNDIELSGVEFSGIPTFGGTFLGQGFTISGIYLRGETSAYGFFRYLQKTALVDDLHLKGKVQPAKSGNVEVGGFVGVNSGCIKNCSFTGTVSGNEQVGGIAGRNKVTGIIENCTVSGLVYGDHYIGGMVGDNQGVIRSCTNEAQVNPQADHNSVSMTTLTLESLTAQESATEATNLGGIAGTSSGVIRDCENHGNVGYEKMGYNVGGIAGSQIGYITECANYGTIHGSHGVGGIVGQFKPNVVLAFGENLMEDLMDQTTDLMGSMSGMMNTMSAMMNSMSVDMEELEETMDALQNPENLDRDSIYAAMNEYSDAVRQMYLNMMASGSQMTGQMSTMMGSMGEMVHTMEKLNEGLNLKIIDVSREDTPENTLTKVSDCTNRGEIFGEHYVGGIAGIADIEDTTVMEEIEGQLNISNEGEIVMRLVIRDCRNLATISATKAYAGGIVGNMTIGAVFHGMNIGGINALSADYVGGIAGSSETYIVNSFNRSILAGNQYVGGIAGYGREAVGNYAISDLAAVTRYAGGILGKAESLPHEAENLVLDNHYYLVGENVGGIDGICYEGATDAMSIDTFLTVENLDDLFRTVTLRFVIPGQEDILRTVELGRSLALMHIPQPEVEEDEQYQWVLQQKVQWENLAMGEAGQICYLSEERLNHILFDQTYEAVFDAKNTVVGSSNLTAAGRPLALVVGTFDQGTQLELVAQEPVVNGAEVLEKWQVRIPGRGMEKLHYHIPDGAQAENLRLLVQDASGNWDAREFTVEGSYMIFSLNYGERNFALEVLPEEPVSGAVIGLGVGGAVVILAILIACKKGKKKGVACEK